MILEVSCPIPVLKSFDYIAPDGTPSDSDVVGRRVLVPFGFRTMTGIVSGVKLEAAGPMKLKTATRFLDEEPLLSTSMMKLGRWMAHRTMCSIGEALFALLPHTGAKGFQKSGFSQDNHAEAGIVSSAPTLTVEQGAAARRLHEAVFGGAFKAVVVRGVAAAGKTEVYLSAIKDAVTAGKSVLYLVPEIGLASQAADILRDRFGEISVTLWHSDLSPKKRRDAWWEIKRQENPIVVGTRSAALVPLENIGLIVVDEEQDPTFKEERKPRFHARDVALQRARDNGAVVIFGSATPSLEAFYMTMAGEAELIELNERAVAAAAPVARLVDLKVDKPRGGSVSTTLRKALSERLQRHEQTILFLNRRGFHRFLRCPQCGWVARCEKCGIAYVHHKGAPARPVPPEEPVDPKRKRAKAVGGGLTCHQCGTHAPIPITCPECKHPKLHAGGTGTERLAEEIVEEFPWAKVLRWDSDSARKSGAQDVMYRDFSQGKADILIGTQVVAQGFNFPNVTLVGVIDADQPLHLPDFRAAERAFQHVMQVGGRAGRELVTGDVIIQTRSADHYALIHAANSDYRGFAAEELRFREDLNYPPYSHIILVRTEAKDKIKAEADMEKLLTWLREDMTDPPVGALGPAPARGPREKSKQLQCLLKVPNARFDGFLSDFRRFLAEGGKKFWVDVDPENPF